MTRARSPCEAGQLGPVAHVRHDQHELVAGQAPDDGRRREPTQAGGHLDQDLVAGLVTERVVHVLEPVEVHDHRCDGSPRDHRAGQRGLQLLLHAAPGAQAGQRVVAGLVGQLALHDLAGRDVGVRGEGPTLLAGHRRDRHHECPQGAVGLRHVVVPLEGRGPTTEDGLHTGGNSRGIVGDARSAAHHRDVVGSDPDLVRGDPAQADLCGPGRVHRDDRAVAVEHGRHGPRRVEQGLHPALVLGLCSLGLDQAGDVAVDRHRPAQPPVLDDGGDRDVGVQNPAVQGALADPAGPAALVDQADGRAAVALAGRTVLGGDQVVELASQCLPLGDAVHPLRPGVPEDDLAVAGEADDGIGHRVDDQTGLAHLGQGRGGVQERREVRGHLGLVGQLLGAHPVVGGQARGDQQAQGPVPGDQGGDPQCGDAQSIQLAGPLGARTAECQPVDAQDRVLPGLQGRAEGAVGAVQRYSLQRSGDDIPSLGVLVVKRTEPDPTGLAHQNGGRARRRPGGHLRAELHDRDDVVGGARHARQVVGLLVHPGPSVPTGSDWESAFARTPCESHSAERVNGFNPDRRPQAAG